MTTDEIIADVTAALDLPAGSIPLHIAVIAEYAQPGSDNAPGRSRLALASDDDLAPWAAMGMYAFAKQLELNDVIDGREVDE